MMVKKGTLLLEESPFVHVLSSNLRKERCEHCYEKCEIRQCSGCRYVGYCDRTCQKAAWIDHKEECCRLAKIPQHLQLPNAARILARIIIKLKRGGDMEKGWYGKNQFRLFKDLMSHYTDIKEDETRLEHLISLKGVLQDYLGQESIPNGVELMAIYGRMVINAFNILDVEMNEIGTGIYLGGSTIDHSCQPNSVAIFKGTTLLIRTTKDIQQFNWNKIRISYIDLLKSRPDRISELKRQYYFNCDCPRCSNENETINELALVCQNKLCNSFVPPPHHHHSSNQIKSGLTCLECNYLFSDEMINKYLETLDFTKEQHLNMKDIAYLDVCKVCLKKQAGCFHPLNIYRTKTLDLAFESSIKLNQWTDALHFGQLLTPGLRRYCGKYHPLVGIHHLRLGKIYIYLDQLDKALVELDKSEEIIKVTHGLSHPLYKTLLLPLLLQAKYSPYQQDK